MLELAAIFYGAVASFVMASTTRNRRERRGNPAIVMLFGWFVLAFSAVMGTMLLGVVTLGVAAGAIA